jgi:hypothetical protein
MDIKIFKKRTLHTMLVLVLSITVLVSGSGCFPIGCAKGCVCTKEQVFVAGIFIALVFIAYEDANIDKDATPVISNGPGNIKSIETPKGCNKKEKQEGGQVPAGPSC